MHVRSLLSSALVALALAGCDEAAATPDAGCSPGGAGCACLEGALCTGDLTCDMGLCVGVDFAELEVLDVSARSCEAVVVEEGTEVLGADFAGGVQGTTIHESPRTAITFLRETDTAFEAGSVRLRRTEAMAPTLRLRHARCFDREGRELPGEPLRVGG